MNPSLQQIQSLLETLFLAFILLTFYLLFQSRIIFKRIEAKKYVHRLEKETDFFNEDHLYTIIYDTFETLQTAAVEQRLDIAKEYMTPAAYDAWSTPLNWAIYQNGYLPPRHTKISCCWIVAIHADLNKQDYFWVYIQGYHDHQPFIVTQEEETQPIGSLKPSRKINRIINNEFQEYWKFIRQEDQFYLDEMIPRKQMKVRHLKSSINL
ncbi:MAG: hypothetical protein ACLRVU_04450 [Beduini sp.]|uniref:hypothetical protein n=1 Tax=Beduini sp. TaxID=1922300 RepID=UPI0039A2879C